MANSKYDAFGANYVVAVLPRLSGDGLAAATAIRPFDGGATAIAAIVGAIVDGIKSKSDSEWKKVVLNDLGEVISALHEIQQMLASLFDFIPVVVDRSLVNSYYETVKSAGQNINRALFDLQATKSEKEQKFLRNSIELLLAELLVAIAKIQNRGDLTDVSAVMAGYGAIFLAMNELELLDSLKSQKRELIKYLRVAIDPSNQNSIGFQRNRMAAEYISKKNFFDSVLGVEWCVGYRYWETGKGVDGVRQGHQVYSYAIYGGEIHSRPIVVRRDSKFGEKKANVQWYVGIPVETLVNYDRNEGEEAVLEHINAVRLSALDFASRESRLSEIVRQYEACIDSLEAGS